MAIITSGDFIIRVETPFNLTNKGLSIQGNCSLSWSEQYKSIVWKCPVPYRLNLNQYKRLESFKSFKVEPDLPSWSIGRRCYLNYEWMPLRGLTKTTAYCTKNQGLNSSLDSKWFFFVISDLTPWHWTRTCLGLGHWTFTGASRSINLTNHILIPEKYSFKNIFLS